MFLAALARKNAEQLFTLGVVEKKMIAVYAYGLELLYSAVITIVGMVIISISMQIAMAWLPFLIAFIPLRLTAGGYHASSHFRCLLLTLAVFLGCLFLVQLLPIQIWPLFITGITVMLIITVLLLAPVETRNKSLSNIEKEQNRNRALTIASINCMMWLATMLLTTTKAPMIHTYFCGVFAAVISLIAGKIRNLLEKRMVHHEETT